MKRPLNRFEWGKVGAFVMVTALPLLILFLVFRNFSIKGCHPSRLVTRVRHF